MDWPGCSFTLRWVGTNRQGMPSAGTTNQARGNCRRSAKPPSSYSHQNPAHPAHPASASARTPAPAPTPCRRRRLHRCIRVLLPPANLILHCLALNHRAAIASGLHAGESVHRVHSISARECRRRQAQTRCNTWAGEQAACPPACHPACPVASLARRRSTHLAEHAVQRDRRIRQPNHGHCSCQLQQGQMTQSSSTC